MKYILLLITSLFGIIFFEKKYIVFGAWFGQRYSDNPKYFFEYLSKSETFNSKKQLVWITKDQEISDRLYSKGYKSALFGTYASAYYISRAKFIITCCGSVDVGVPLFTRAKFIELWHGIALKKIGFDCFSRNKNLAQLIKNILGRLTSLYHPTFYNKKAFILSPSDYTDNIYINAFGKTARNLIKVNQPRYDILKSSVPNKKSTLKIAYLPTHRSENGIENIKNLLEELLLLTETLEKLDVEVYIKMHFYNLNSINDIVNKNNSNRIKFIISNDRFFDLYKLLSVIDILVTDYSSIYFDFMVTGRPVIALTNDLEAYKEKERDLYVEYETYAFNGHFKSWKEVLAVVRTNDLMMYSSKNHKYVELQSRMVGGIRGNMSLLQELVQL